MHENRSMNRGAFLAAARRGSFTRAVEKVNVGQPAFAVQIRQLEALALRMARSRELISRPIQGPGIDREVGILQMRGR